MKILALVNLVAPDPNGKTINVKPGRIADVRDDKAQYYLDEGYAEEVSAKAEKAEKKTGGRQTPTQKAATTRNRGVAKDVTQKSTADDKPRTRRSRDVLTGGRRRNPDAGGENGNGEGDE